MSKKKSSAVPAKTEKPLVQKIGLRFTAEPFFKVWKSLTANTNQALVAQIQTLKAQAAKATNPQAKHVWLNAAKSLEGLLAAEQKPTRDAFINALISGCASIGIKLARKDDGVAAAVIPAVTAKAAVKVAPTAAPKVAPKVAAKPAVAKSVTVASKGKGKSASSKKPKPADPATAQKIVDYLKAEKATDKSSGKTPRTIFAALKIKPANLSKTFKNSKEVEVFGHAGGKVFFYKGS